MATTGSANMFVLNLQELQNVVTSAAGPTQTLNAAVAQLQQMVLFDTKQILADSIRPFSSNATAMSSTTIQGPLIISSGTPGIGKYLTCLDETGTAQWGPIAQPSDARFKKNVRPLASEPIMAGLHGVRFEWGNGRTDVGVIAQDVEKVLPEAFIAGNPAAVEYYKIIPVLIEEIKRLEAKVDALTASMNAA